jgi:hypothetical protein
MPAITLSWRCCFQHLLAWPKGHATDRPPRPLRKRPTMQKKGGRRNRPTENETTPPGNPLVGRLLASLIAPFFCGRYCSVRFRSHIAVVGPLQPASALRVRWINARIGCRTGFETLLNRSSQQFLHAETTGCTTNL